jgi:Trk K+ transport system NAD-binding subunit
MLIGIISSGIDEKLEELKKGKSFVNEKNHTLIIGWSNKIFSIIEEIIEANANQRNQRIVIVADRDKVEMEDEINSKIQQLKTTRIIVRNGNPLVVGDTLVGNPNEARSIILLSPDEADSDMHVIKSMMSLTNRTNRKKDTYKIVTEIKDRSNLEAAHLVGQTDDVIVVDSSELVAHITTQTCRQSGLSVVYSTLLRFEGDEIYMMDATKYSGKTYKEVLFMFNSSVIIGIYSSGKIQITPSMEYVIQAQDELIGITADDDTFIPDGKSSQGIDSSIFNFERKSTSNKERTLILGWNETAITIVNELENYVQPGSELCILSEQIQALPTFELKNQSLRLMEGDIQHRKTLESLNPESFDNIIILSNHDVDVQQSDSKTLICLLHLRSIAEKNHTQLKIVSEMRDIRNREIAVVAKADDFIVGDNIISLLIAQIAENHKLKAIFDELLNADGSEIYLKSIEDYIQLGKPTNFYTLLERAAQANQTAIGYRHISDKENEHRNFGVHLNPRKDDLISFSSGDFLIVISED